MLYYVVFVNRNKSPYIFLFCLLFNQTCVHVVSDVWQESITAPTTLSKYLSPFCLLPESKLGFNTSFAIQNWFALPEVKVAISLPPLALFQR